MRYFDVNYSRFKRLKACPEQIIRSTPLIVT
nr:MAG TPA: hypothetical protein [Herelleviridae sp.]